jgi:hypothetical protein
VSDPLKSKGFLFLPEQEKTRFWTCFLRVSRHIAAQLIVMAAANPTSATGRRWAELSWDWRSIFGSPSKALGAKDGEDFKDPVSGGS